MSSLENKVAIVTGGSRGIGLACAQEIIACGGRVMITGRDETKLSAALDELGEQAASFAGDVVDDSSVAECVNETLAKLGSIDILINNAGGPGRFGFVAEQPIAEFDKVIALNLRAPLCWTQKVWQAYMKENGGVIINISSVAGLGLQPMMAAYCSSKTALNQLTKSLAAELSPKVRVNAIAPGLTTSDATMPLLKSGMNVLSRIPIGRVGEGSDIARAVRFLASDEAAWITGSILAIDGGNLVNDGRMPPP